MLPPGHIAGGYLTAKVLLHFTHQAFSHTQINQLLWWGVFFGFAPDLDSFYTFFKSKSFKVNPKAGDHRKYFSHAPILWLLAGLTVYAAATSPFFKTFGLLIWLSSWSHFVLDSIQYGIMWLWPLNKKVYCFYPLTNKGNINTVMIEAAENQKFFNYWVIFIKEYSKGLIISLTCEIILLFIALIVFLHH
jgi:hypothetical protein